MQARSVLVFKSIHFRNGILKRESLPFELVMNIPVLLVVTWVLASEPALLTDVAMLMGGVEMKWKPKVSNIHSYVLALARTVQGHCASGIAPWPEPRRHNMVWCRACLMR